MSRQRPPAQALVEIALVIPLLLLIGFSGVAVGRLVRVHMAVDAVAREAAREATLAPLPRETGGDNAQEVAEDMGHTRGEQVASDYGLSNVTLQVRAPGFDRGSWVEADATYTVDDRDLACVPFRTVTFHAHHREQVDQYRSRSL